ncbi:prepilin-type N-terminal cleavage/methylation domain-containing protein [Clostridium thermarum]|uniref:prepilin-type N-terminal cleavage/methylation domain-containing protein n=1 Tax=Clostridium thermarum TaxID=1716543 RepID=UPI001121EE88|nr:type II secretion system protein [Clostridium thermarum]
MRIKKGFTLIELMIVISVIGILTMVITPNVTSVRTQSKNQSVTTNVMLVRSFIESRGARDAIILNAAFLEGKSYSEIMAQVLSGIKSDMTQYFSGSNALQNPFNNATSINYTHQDVRQNNPASASVVLGYSADPNAELPADVRGVGNALGKDKSFAGDVVVILYKAGYVLYGIDNSGDMIDINIIKNPPIPPVVQSGVGGGNGSSPGGINDGGPVPTGILKNIGDVVTYIKSIAIDKILRGEPLNKIWDVMKNPLNGELKTQFTPGNTSKHIVNPYNNSDSIGIYYSSSITGNYSIISVHDADAITTEDTAFSDKPGTVIVYVTSNPTGYVVYGVDQDGDNVGYTTINLSTMVTPEMNQTLANNVAMVSNILKANIKTLAVGDQGDLSNAAYNALKNLNISNSYWAPWKKIGKLSSDSFLQGYALIVSGWNMEGARYSDFKGSVAVNVLKDCTGYEVFGIDEYGNRYHYEKVVR